MKKIMTIILFTTIIISTFGCSSNSLELGGFYQSEVNGYHVQILIQKEDNRFIEWIDNREVDKGTYVKNGDNSYTLNSEIQNFDIDLNNDNSFDIIIEKINDGSPITMRNISPEDTTISFGHWDDINEYKKLLN